MILIGGNRLTFATEIVRSMVIYSFGPLSMTRIDTYSPCSKDFENLSQPISRVELQVFLAAVKN